VGDWGLLGKVLAKETSNDNLANIDRLVERARHLLTLVRDRFPTYTLHDDQHAKNVIHLMGKLVAPRIEVMTPLEAALLILAAYFHDAGMAYSAEDLEQIPEEDEFLDFLESHDDVYLATQRNGDVPPPSVIERYCRERHADRVRVHLDACEQDLRWNGSSILDALELICRSHGEPATALHHADFQTDFLYAADLRFCAIILRLSDILDLDETRAPAVVHDYLRLSGHETAEVAISDRKWRQHMAARGFTFPPRQDPNYTIQFAAEPAEPGIEHDLREFLTVVEDELLHCRSVTDICGDRWRGIPLPGTIDTRAINSNGYRYGQFRFELDRAAVLELFTGEQLYEDPEAFLRELLQNAFDAVRAREHLYGYKSAGIHVSCWEDGGGYIWVRVDDDGIGMDENTLSNYFLRVGRSYYSSAEFRAALGRSGLADQPFGVISRFGVGVLACFMVGDQVEVSSRAAGKRGSRAVRLSINRRDDYFVLQDDSRRSARKMPGRGGPEPAFRREPGTRIAVRVNPNRSSTDLTKLLARLESYVAAPPVPIFANDIAMAPEIQRLTAEPLVSASVITELDTSGFPSFAHDRSLPFMGDVRIAVVPLDLNSVAECPGVNGQLVAYVALPPPADKTPTDLVSRWPILNEEVKEALSEAVSSVEFSLKYVDEEIDFGAGRVPYLRLIIKRSLVRGGIEKAYNLLMSDVSPTSGPPLRGASTESQAAFLAASPLDLALILKGHLDSDRMVASTDAMIPVTDLPGGTKIMQLKNGRSWWSYNGVALPVHKERSREPKLGTSDAVVVGALDLSGEMRPDLTVSRSRVHSLPFPVQSAVHLAIRHAAGNAAKADPALSTAVEAFSRETVLHAPRPAEPCTAEVFHQDRLLRDGLWNREAVLRTPSGWRSVEDLVASARNGENPGVTNYRFRPWEDNYSLELEFPGLLPAGLLHFFLDVEFVPPGVTNSQHDTLVVRSGRRPQHHPGSRLFPPLFAVPFRGTTTLARVYGLLNVEHPLTRWLLENATTLADDFPAPFQRVLRRAPWIYSSDEINDALAQVARSAPEIAAPPSAYLREDRLGAWWSRDSAAD
jgi:hypothetical protein